MLHRTYETIPKDSKLKLKVGFRQELGREQDSVYVSYPPHGLGLRGCRAIVGFFEDGHSDDA